MRISRIDNPPACIWQYGADSLRRTRRPAICITTGDPRGIGPEIIASALKSPTLKGRADYLVIGNKTIKKNDKNANAKASVEFINTAFSLIKQKKAGAIVTGPVSKEAINKAGIKFEGHTEYLAKLCGCKKFAMMFVSDKLKIVILTRHIALRQVADSLSTKLIYDTVGLTREALRNWLGIKLPKIGIAGLNPHCGEGGLFGKEEKLIITPAVRRLQKKFKGIFGPIPADTLLYDTYHRRLDAAVCMYHDQGLAAFKMIAREDGVNLTLGLPFIRTSVDHGTGFDIAGKGIADPGSMIAAIKLALRLVNCADN